MARNIYGASGAAQVVSLTGTPTLAAATVKTARTGGTTVTDIQNMSGANLGGVVTPDSRGQIIFQGPDNSSATYWLDFADGGPRWGVSPVDFTAMTTNAMAARELAQYTAPGSATPEAAIPYVANHPTAKLALALEGMVTPKFASASARDTAYATPSDGDRCYRTDLHAGQTYRTGIGGTNRWVTDSSMIMEGTIASDAATISFPNIPQEWRNLVIKYRARATGSAAAQAITQQVAVQFNGDTASNYAGMGAIRRMKIVSGVYTYEVDGAGAGGSATITTAANYAGLTIANGSGGLTNFSLVGQTGAVCGICAGSSLSSLFGGGEICVDDYTSATSRKPIHGTTGFMDNGGASGTSYASHAALQGGWNNNAAITRVDLRPVSATAFVAGSYFALYGLS